jgi:hypothetical protein
MIGDTTTDLSGYVTKDELTAHETAADGKYATKQALTEHESTATATYATKAEVTEHMEAAEGKYAIKTEVETALGNKADASALASYYTKDEIEGKGYAVAETVASDLAAALANYYTKTEIDNKLGAIDDRFDNLDESITTVTKGTGISVTDAGTGNDHAYTIALDVNGAKTELGLGTAAYENVGAFEVAGAASTLQEALCESGDLTVKNAEHADSADCDRAGEGKRQVRYSVLCSGKRRRFS